MLLIVKWEMIQKPEPTAMGEKYISGVLENVFYISDTAGRQVKPLVMPFPVRNSQYGMFPSCLSLQQSSH